MRESRTCGSVRGARDETRVPTAPGAPQVHHAARRCDCVAARGTPNSGLATYDPPPGAVVKYGKPSLATTVAEPIAPVELPIAAAALIDPEPATTGRSTPEPELKPTIAAPHSQPRTAKRPNREVRIDSPKQRGAACIPGYDSSGAQTRPCG
jgi:hypothetical protein